MMPVKGVGVAAPIRQVDALCDDPEAVSHEGWVGEDSAAVGVGVPGLLMQVVARLVDDWGQQSPEIIDTQLLH